MVRDAFQFEKLEVLAYLDDGQDGQRAASGHGFCNGSGVGAIDPICQGYMWDPELEIQDLVCDGQRLPTSVEAI